MKNTIKKLTYIILIGAINFAICATPWMPNRFLEVLLWGLFIGLTLLSIYLIANVLKESTTRTSPFNSFLPLGVIGGFVAINFINFVFIMFLGSYENTYQFNGKQFYVYDTSFRDRMCEISVKMDYLPIRKEIVSWESSAEDNVLYRDGDMVYFLQGTVKHNIYDLNKSTIVIIWG